MTLLTKSEKSTNVRAFHGRLPLKALSAASPTTGALVAERLILQTHRRPITSIERERLSVARAGCVKTSFGVLRAWSWGQGPTVLLVHGWNGYGGQLTAWVAQLVAAGFRAVSFDAGGHGLSTGKTNSVPQLASEIQAVADAHPPVHGIVAHSMGGLSATLALARGLSARRVVLVAPAVFATRMLEASERIWGLTRNASVELGRRLSSRFGDLATTSADTLASQLSISALIIHDKDDQEVPHADSEQLVKAWPGARLVSTEGLGHRRILSDPEVIDAGVGFLVSPPRLLSWPMARGATSLVEGDRSAHCSPTADHTDAGCRGFCA